MPSSAPSRPSGFTIIEVMVVMIVLGILAAVTFPAFAGVTDESRRAAFVSELRVYTDAAERYNAKTGSWPEDSSSGTMPDGLEDYWDAADWTRPTPLGGVWDTEFNDSGVTAALGVHFNTGDQPSDEDMAIVDALIDDGDLEDGDFQQLTGDRFYRILDF
jgi:prepilin-type N-terminal cleavage/methylation domain-containing protein